jgi:large subunit ribosomal protein L30
MKLRVTLKRSYIGRNENHRRILRSLGLKKINQSVIHGDTPPIRGMIDKVTHMVEVSRVKAGSRSGSTSAAGSVEQGARKPEA